jgi:putative flippase GtrA
MKALSLDLGSHCTENYRMSSGRNDKTHQTEKHDSRAGRLKKIFDIRFFRFLSVGLFNTAFGYTCFAFFIYAGFHYSLALFSSMCLGILFNYKTTGHFVFNTKHNRRIAHFFFAYSFVYVINLIGLKFLSSVGVDDYRSGAAMVLPMAILSYWLNKKLVFVDCAPNSALSKN